MRLRTAVAVIAAAAGGATAVVAVVPASGHPPAHRAAAASITTVRFGEYFFKPKTITIRAGASVRFTNVGKIEHTVADSTRSGTILSRVIHPRPLKHGQSQTVRFTRRGTIHYLCTFHPTLMRGVVIVR